MKSRLSQVLSRCLRGRQIALWGSPTRSVLTALVGHSYHPAQRVDPKTHYVLAVTEDDLDDFLQTDQSEGFEYVTDYLTFCDTGGELPFAWSCFGAEIGRQTYLSESVVDACREGMVKSVGHFTSINGSAVIAANHQLDMTFVSDDIQRFFAPETQARFDRCVKNNPGHPYALGKPPITIGSDVYIGAGAFINASKVTSIGDGAIIGSGAVVLSDVPPYAVVVGVPAKIKRYRFSPEMIDTLLRVKWWQWSPEEINANADALIQPQLFLARFG